MFLFCYLALQNNLVKDNSCFCCSFLQGRSGVMPFSGAPVGLPGGPPGRLGGGEEAPAGFVLGVQGKVPIHKVPSPFPRKFKCRQELSTGSPTTVPGSSPNPSVPGVLAWQRKGCSELSFSASARGCGFGYLHLCPLQGREGLRTLGDFLLWKEGSCYWGNWQKVGVCPTKQDHRRKLVGLPARAHHKWRDSSCSKALE